MNKLISALRAASAALTELDPMGEYHDAAQIDDALAAHTYRLPVRDDVETLTYHRNPTAAEVRFGAGAIHYRDFTVSECCFPGTRIARKWFVASNDGLRYYR